MSTVTQLHGTKIAAARRLVANAIPQVRLASIGSAGNGPHTTCRDFLTTMNLRWGTTESLPEDLWLGVAGGNGQLVAALHAAPLVGTGSKIIESLYRGSTNAGSPSWVAQLLREVLMVEEIAVVPAERRRGHGAALLTECHRIARARGVTDVQAHAGSTAAQDLFRSAGYIVGPPRTPVPKDYQCGLRTVWDPIMYTDPAGSHVYNHIDQLR